MQRNHQDDKGPDKGSGVCGGEYRPPGFKGCLATEQILIGSRVTRNRGTGGNQELGEQAAEESVNAIEDVISGADMIFITAEWGEAPAQAPHL